MISKEPLMSSIIYWMQSIKPFSYNSITEEKFIYQFVLHSMGYETK